MTFEKKKWYSLQPFGLSEYHFCSKVNKSTHLPHQKKVEVDWGVNNTFSKKRNMFFWQKKGDAVVPLCMNLGAWCLTREHLHFESRVAPSFWYKLIIFMVYITRKTDKLFFKLELKIIWTFFHTILHLNASWHQCVKLNFVIS